MSLLDWFHTLLSNVTLVIQCCICSHDSMMLCRPFCWDGHCIATLVVVALLQPGTVQAFTHLGVERWRCGSWSKRHIFYQYQVHSIVCTGSSAVHMFQCRTGVAENARRPFWLKVCSAGTSCCGTNWAQPASHFHTGLQQSLIHWSGHSH